MAPGFIVQVPVGNPFNCTLPVATVQVGCVIVPMVGAAGVVFTIMVTLPVMLLVQDVEVFVATTVYVPAAVWLPKEMAEPVPETGEPVLLPLSFSWYRTPVC